MERNEIIEVLTKIFQIVMDNECIVLSEDTMAEDIEEWDSLSHVQLIDAIQKKFGIKFSSKEMMSWDNVGEFVDTIIQKLN